MAAKVHGYDEPMAKKESARLQSERESCPVPCCGAILVIDLNLGRIISHSEPPSGLNIELSDAQRILADEKARREAAFEQSFNTERTKGDALPKRFEEALKQARAQQATRPSHQAAPATSTSTELRTDHLCTASQKTLRIVTYNIHRCRGMDGRTRAAAYRRRAGGAERRHHRAAGSHWRGPE